MENEVRTVVTSIVSSSAVASAVVWFLRSFVTERLRASIQHEYDQKLEAFKAEQENIRIKETERLRSDLHIAATEREIVFRGLQEKRADVIANVFAGLHGAHVALQVYSNDLRFENPSDEELLDRLSKSFDTINEHFYPKVIYLPRKLVERIREVLNKMQRLLRDVRRDRKPGAQWSAEKLEEIQNRIDEVKDDLPKRMDELEDLFRELLGSQQNRLDQS